MEDFDLFSDEPVVTQARAGAKFQPKFKHKAKAKVSGSIASKPTEVTKEEAATVVSASIDAVQVVEIDNAVDDSKSSQVINPSQLVATDTLHAESAVCDNTNLSFERSVGEVTAMEDSDLFPDESLLIQARAGAKPKAKAESSGSIPLKNPEITKDGTTPIASNAVQVVKLDNTVDDGKSSQVINPSQLAATDSLHAKSVVCHDTNSSFERSVGEVTAMEDSDLFPDESLLTKACAGAKFQPKFKPKAKAESSGSIPLKNPEITKDETTQIASDAVQVVEPDNTVDDGQSSQVINPSQLAATDSLHAKSAVCDDTNSSYERSVGEHADLISGLECIDPLHTQISKNDGDIGNDYEGNSTQFQEAGALPDIDTLDIMSDMKIASGRRAGKFKPKPRLQTSVLTSPPAVVGEGSIPDLPAGPVPSCSPVDSGSFIPPDPSTSECQLNEGPLNLAVASNSGVDPAMPREVSPDIIERNTSPASNSSRKSKRSSTRDKVNGNGKARKQSKEQVTNLQIVDDLEDGTCNEDGPAVELPHSCAINEVKDTNNGDENDDDKHNVEHVSEKRRTSKKRAKKPANESEKPPQKSKRAKKGQKHEEVIEASDIPEKEQKKKFPHSTRRKRRLVDESLLNMPEDEIDFARVALKDLILLADYKERLAKKEAKALGVPLTDQGTQKTFDEENAGDEESYIASEQDQGFTDDQVSGSAKSTSYFNYQTHMNKNPRVRWSKQDTELFYGAIRQFGPDFSLIEQLFPGRNRHQIKLKFKNEERRSPFKLSDALASRANDHSYFEKVIEQLRQVSGADLESNGDVSNDLTREEEESTPGTNEEVEKTEPDKDVAVGDQEVDVTDDHNSLKSDEMDDDNELLSSYQSAF